MTGLVSLRDPFILKKRMMSKRQDLNLSWLYKCRSFDDHNVGKISSFLTVPKNS